MMRRATLLLVSAFATAFLLSSCDAELNQVNPNQLTTSSYFKNGSQLETGVNAIYANLNVTGMYKRRKYFVYDALSGVVTAGGGQTESWIPEMINWNHGDGTNSGETLHWTGLYQGIKRANLVIENGPSVTKGIDADLRSRFIGEAYFLRAFYYDKLMALWGESGTQARGVPLLTEAKDQVGGEPLADASSVDSLIEADLQVAIDSLPWSYSESANIGRATKTAAYAVKGRAHLRQEEWSQAANAFLQVIDNGEAPGGGDLRLVDNYFDNFKEETENNAESIWEIQHAQSSGGSAWSQQGGDGTTRTFRNQEYGFLEWRNVVASQSVLGEMGVSADGDANTQATVGDVSDPRASNTFYFACDTYNNGNSVYTTAANPKSNCPSSVKDLNTPEPQDNRPSWKKFQLYYKTASPPSGGNSGNNFRDLRYAEVLLGLAEAKVFGDATAGPSATSLINQVRSRVGLPGASATERQLFHEFVLEFTGEPPLMMFLQRHPSYLRPPAPALNPNAPSESQSGPIFQPIPLEEIENNPEIPSDINSNLPY